MGTQKDIYDDATYDAVLSRIGDLRPDTRPRWGGMNSAQMLAHCAEIAEVANGKALVGTPWMVKLFSGFIRKMVVSEKPYPRESRTHPQYVVSDSVDFEEQKTRLLEVLAELKLAGPNDGKSHALFGTMTPEEKGWAGFKHLDHHLTQFGM